MLVHGQRGGSIDRYESIEGVGGWVVRSFIHSSLTYLRLVRDPRLDRGVLVHGQRGGSIDRYESIEGVGGWVERESG